MKKQQIDHILTRMLDSHGNVSDLNITPGKPLQVESSGELVAVNIEPYFKLLTPFQTEIFALNLIDRALEIILWVVFCHLGLIPLLIPLIVITRGTLTDAVRCVGTCNGESAFNQIKNPLGRFLVSSRFMRNFYGAIKGTAFAVLTLDFGFQTLEHAWSSWIHPVAVLISWMTIVLTLVRGLPVILEEVSFLKKPL